ncbi:MAG: cyclase family protein [Anaerolineae bacterium]|nr:cyclase family protein [Anaerolineae bacterium]
MCSPEIARVVRERSAKEGVSRRGFLKLGGFTAAGLAIASAGLPARVARAHEEATELIDLSHVFSPASAVYTPGEEPTRETFVSVKENGYYIQKWSFYEHAGTHVDIPAHFVDGGETVDNYAPASYLSPAVVIDISAKAAENPDATLDLADIEAWEAANGAIPVGAVVAMYSGWDARWSDAVQFRNADADGVQHYPGFSGEAAAFLVEERDIHGIAVDTLSLDPGNSATFDTHLTVLGAGKYGIENVANLGQLIGKAATIMVGVPRWEEGSGGPARVLALV